MGIGESLKEKKGCVFFFILFRFADTISSEKELKGLDLSCPHFPFMSYTYPTSIGIYFFGENKKKRKEREMSSFLSALESRDVGDWAFLPLFSSITFPLFLAYVVWKCWIGSLPFGFDGLNSMDFSLTVRMNHQKTNSELTEWKNKYWEWRRGKLCQCDACECCG